MSWERKTLGLVMIASHAVTNLVMMGAVLALRGDRTLIWTQGSAAHSSSSTSCPELPGIHWQSAGRGASA